MCEMEFSNSNVNGHRFNCLAHQEQSDTNNLKNQ